MTTSTPISPVQGDWAPAVRPAERVDQARYWTGAALSALIAGLAGVAGLVAAHGIAHVPVLLARGTTLTPVHATVYGLLAAACALAAAALYAGMLRLAPRPSTYYSWLIGMLTLLAVLLPFTSTVALSSQIAFSAINLLVGLIVMVLVPLAAVHARLT